MRRFQGIFLSSLPPFWQPCSLIILTSLSMAFVDVFATYRSLELHGQPWDQPWGVTPYQVPPRLNRLLYGSLTLSESVSENGSEDYGSSGSGDVGRLELDGSPSTNEPMYVAIMPPPGLSQDIGDVAKAYPVGQRASLGLPILASPSGFANKINTPPPDSFQHQARSSATSRTSTLPSSLKAMTWRSMPPSSLSLA